MARAPGDPVITVRRMRFEYPSDIDPVVVDGEPEESAVIVGLSLLLPYLEPYLVRSAHEAKRFIRDPDLVLQVDQFNAQEGQHYRQHAAFNAALRLPGIDKLRRLESDVDADYKRFSRTRTLRWNLAYAEGFEAFTSAMARFSFDTGRVFRLRPEVRDLWAWHLVEELEHRTVAFDVYDHVYGGYFYRLAVGLYAQWHLNRFVLRAADIMLKADRVAFRERFGGVRRGLQRTLPQLWLMTTRLLPKILATYLPWYTPHRIDMPASARALAEQYTGLAAQKPLAPDEPVGT
jgi:hypothetical protein